MEISMKLLGNYYIDVCPYKCKMGIRKKIIAKSQIAIFKANKKNINCTIWNFPVRTDER